MKSRLFLLWLLIFSGNLLFAEGTKELTPSSGDNGDVQIFDQNSLQRPFATFNCPEENRLNFSICNLGEKVYFGFQQNDNDVYFRIKDPNGNLVSINGNTINPIPQSGQQGYIKNYNQAVTGPKQITSGGYNALSFTPTMTGDYYIEFNPKKSGQAADVIWAQKRVFKYFDITVASASNQAIPGRLWSKSWDLQCNAQFNPFKGIMYVYSDDGIVTSLNFNGMQPYGFVVFCNSSGLKNTGNPTTDRQSEYGNINYPQYKIFLNDPDSSCFPTGTFGKLTAKSTVTGCSENNYCINVYTDQGGSIEVLLDLNGVSGYQPNTSDLLIEVKDAVVGHNCIPWDGLDGQGNPVPYGTQINFEVNYFNGLTHLPLYDAEYNVNGFIVNLVRPAGPKPAMYWDDSKIGGTVNLTGCTSATGCHSWNNNFGNEKTINTWWHAATVKDTLNFSINFIEVDAWEGNGFGNGGGTGNGKANDTTICGNMSFLQLDGAVKNATGGVWTTNGTGTFSDSTDLKGKYFLSTADIAKGSVTLTLTSTGNGSCAAVSDSLSITINQVPTVNAQNVSVCSNNAVATMNATITNTPGATWSGGTGTFNNNRTVKATYTPTQTEINNKSVQLTLTTDTNGVCPPASATMTLSFTPTPVISTPTSLSICKNNPTVPLNASVTGASGGQWSGGSGTFSNNASLNTTYTPSVSDISSGSITLTLTTTGNGNCNAVNSQVVISFTNPPVVNAGTDQTLCANNAVASLSGSSTTGTTTWSGGAGSFGDPSQLNTTYTPSSSETQKGDVVLYLSSQAGNCLTVQDSIKLTFTPAPTANLGSDQFVCGNNPTVTLTAKITVATGGQYSGAGTFSNPNSLTTLYTPSSNEIKTGLAPIIFTTSGSGNCLETKDTLLIVISPAPVAAAGSDQNICKNNPNVALNGLVSNATGESWSGGNGTFNPTRSVLNPVYTPTASELQSGSVTLILSASKATCNTVYDTLIVNFTPAPTAIAGSDKTVCTNNSNIQLNGSVMVAGGGQWSSAGSGTFTPSADSLNTVYKPTSTEIQSGVVNLILTTTNNGNCLPEDDTIQVKFTPSPQAFAGADQTVCANNPDAQLNGSVQRATGGTWSGGNGAFSPGSSTLNAVYTPTTSEINAGSVDLILTTTGNGDCNPVSDTVTISFSPAPTANPGGPYTICADNPVVTLNGSVMVAAGGIWSGGNGTFKDATNLNTTYTATPNEIANGTVKLTLTTTANGNCNSVSQDVNVTIVPVPVVNAGTPQTLCGSATQVNISGTVKNAGGGDWSIVSGSGSFVNPVSLSTQYTPSIQDKTSGTVRLKLTSTNNGTCNAVSDEVEIDFTIVPTVNAGPDQTVCTNDFPVSLQGSGSAASWNGGAGTFTPDRNTLNAQYQPDASETGTTVTLTLTTQPSGACPSVSDQANITIPAGPVVNAGPDQQVCGNLSTISLSGNVSNASGGTWTTTGSGTIAAPNALSTTYTISSNDRNTGKIAFILTSSGNGFCSAVTDTMFAQISQPISVNPGPAENVCADFLGIPLSGSVQNAQGGLWTSSGNGTFDHADSLSTTYRPAASDSTLSSITFTLTSTGNGICSPVSKSVTYTITPAPKVSLGPDFSVCADSAYYPLSATFSVAKGVNWATTGTGSFSPDAVSPSTSYYPVSADKTAGKVVFIATTTDNGTCRPVSDTLTVSISGSPVISAGSDTSLCADAGTIQLKTSLTVAKSVLWSSSGSGKFNDSTLTNPIYTFSSQDSINQTVTLTVVSTQNGNCKAVKAAKVISLTPAPTLNAGQDQTLCANVNTISVQANVQVATSATWTSSGSGSFTSNGLSASYTPSSADTAAHSIYLMATSGGNGKCKAVKDSVKISFNPVPQVFAGNDITICADSTYVNLSGHVTHATSGIWSASGGNFVPKADTLVTSYVPGSAEKSNGSVNLILTSAGNGSCSAINDTLKLTITTAPTAQAGFQTTVCADTTYIQLNGSITVAGGGQWTTSGSGTFSNPTDLNGKYFLSSNDIDAGSVILTLHTTQNGQCNVVKADRQITITPAPKAHAGTDQTVCADATSIQLNGSVKTASGGVWTSSGTGQFSPGSSSLNATYVPSGQDTTNKTVALALSTTGNGLCKAVTDTIVLSITPRPIVNAGSDQTVCADYTGIPVTGSILHASAAKWTTTGNGYFSPSPSQLSTTYVPTAQDKSRGYVSLILTTTSMGTCNPVSDTTKITILPKPIVSAGNDQEVCADFEEVALTGKVMNAGGGIWTTSGSGTFSPTVDSLGGSYIPSSQDITNQSVVLTLTSREDSVCTSVSDAMVLTIDPVPSADAGFDQNICKDASVIKISGSVTNAKGGFWQSSGYGTFANDTLLNTTYSPTASDKAAGNLTFTLITTGNGACTNHNSSFQVTFTNIPTVDAGNDTTICADASTVNITGQVTTASGGIWSTTGDGSFSPSVNSLSAKYSPGSSDIANGKVSVSLTTTGNGNCQAYQDSSIITLQAIPSANAGSPVTICADTAGIQLNGVITNATGGTWTTGSGTGTFTPDNNQPNTVFQPSSAQINNGKATLTLTTTGNGACASRSSVVVVSITKVPVVNAGSDLIVCAGLPQVELNGQVSIASGGHWSGGAGSFSQPDSMKTTYTFGGGENSDSTKTVTLQLTSTGNGSCKAVTDTLMIHFSPAPPIHAGPDQTVCDSDLPVDLAASGNNGQWSGGTGTFTPSRNSLTATYMPTPSEVSNGSLKLYIQTVNNGSCSPGQDSLSITFVPGPKVDAGSPAAICANEGGIALSPTVSNASSTIWTTDGYGSFDNASNPNATYIFSPQDVIAGQVTLTLTVPASGFCKDLSDTVNFSFTPAPEISAGTDQSVCATIPSINLKGGYSVATQAEWNILTGAGSVANINDSTTSYTPAPADTLSGVVLRFVTTQQGTCKPVADTTRISFSSGPSANPGSPITICADSVYVQLNGSISAAKGGEWTTPNGTGIFSPDAFALNAVYQPSSNDTANGSVTLTLTTTGTGDCPAVSNQIILTITPAPEVMAGGNTISCKDVVSIPLNASYTVAGGIAWSTSGTGTFVNDSSATATYTPSTTDKEKGSVVLTASTIQNGMCKVKQDNMQIDFTPTPTIDAGYPQTVCKNTGAVNLDAIVTVASGVTWTSGNSSGFSQQDSIQTQYTPDASEYSNGTTLLTVTSTGNGTCHAVSDTVRLNFTPAPTVNAGSDVTACADTMGISLHPSITLATGGTWTTSGTGTFTPSFADTNAVYVPSSADTSARSVLLTLTSTGNGDCNAVKDTTRLTFNPAPVVISGSTINICSDINQVNLNGKVFNASSQFWTSSGSGTFSDPTTLNPVYTPSATDKNTGGVIFTLTSSGKNCHSYSDYSVLFIHPAVAVKVNAGQDQVLCSDAALVSLEGFVYNATGGTWATPNGSGSLNDPTNLEAKYTINKQDIQAKEISFVLTSTGNGFCNPVSDTMHVTFTPIPTVDAGSRITVCGDTSAIPLNGSVTVATGGKWTSSGSGYFSPNATTLNAKYVPSGQDIKNGLVYFTLTTTGNGTCNTYHDMDTVTITPPPTVSAGSDQHVCADAQKVYLKGTYSQKISGLGLTWTTSGKGSFSSATDPSAYYIPTAADTTVHIVTITATTTNNGQCKAVKSSMKIDFTPVPSVNAGTPELVCSNTGSVTLKGRINVASGGVWTTAGSGSFSPSATTLNSSYIPSGSDKSGGSVLLTLTTTGNGACNAVEDTVRISFSPAPTADAGNASNCVYELGASLNGVITNASGGQWTSSGTGSFSPDAYSLKSTYYPSQKDFKAGKVILTLSTTGNGVCQPANSQATFIISELPQADAGKTRYICQNTSTNLVAATENQCTYFWSRLSGDTIAKTQYLNANITKDTSFVLTVTDTKGCFSKDTVSVMSVIRPKLNLANESCLVSGLTLQANLQTTTSNLGDFAWFMNGALISGRKDSTLPVSRAGTYKVTYTIGACIGEDSGVVTSPPALTSPDDIICKGAPVYISTTNNNTYQYKWTSGGKVYGYTDSVSVLPTADTTKYNVAVTDSKGCTSYDSVYVVTLPAPDPKLNDSSLCQGQQITLSGTVKNVYDIYASDATYTWFKNGQSTGSDSTLQTNVSGKYKVIITIGECIGSDSAKITFNPNPVAFIPDEIKFCEDTGAVTLDAGPGSHYAWSNGDTTQTIRTDVPGHYHVTVTNQYNCSLTDSIYARSFCDPHIYTPTAFFPTGSNSEDHTFILFGKDYKNFTITIFNRWGEIIFYSEDPKAGWDGTYRGEPMQSGVYPYIITYDSIHIEKQGKREKQGAVTLIR